MKKYTIAIAGSTQKTTLCAKTLLKDKSFEIVWILTPKAKPVGRKKIVTPNPLDAFARENKLPVTYIEKRIGDASTMSKFIVPDFLLVVDFGYIVPSWLLKLPKISPLNIHPSELPKWRGSSPGQFSILFNDKKSAVTLMKINDKFDQGPIIHQDFFEVDSSWNQENYYSHAFELICDGLGEKIRKFAENSKLAISQPEISPTIMAKILKKDQTFVTWNIVKMAIKGENLGEEKLKLSKLLLAALEHNRSIALTLERASKAFFPWPGLWTIIPTQKGEKRMKLLETVIINEKLILKTVQIEGKNPGLWEDVKNSVWE